MYSILKFLPKNHLSFLLGKLANLPLFYPLSYWTVSSFAKYFKIDLSEVERPLREYNCIGQFFIRKLKPGARPPGKGLLSPIDGTLRSHGRILGGDLEQIKGKNYSVGELLGDEGRAREFANGYYFNFYLSPQDYHRVHSPLAGNVIGSTYVPGKLWPVNDWALTNIPRLLAVNERLVTYLEWKHGRAALVMVGATNVGKMSVTYDTWKTNGLSRVLGLSRPETRTYPVPRSVRAGDEIGIFHMGSSVVLLLDEKLSEAAAAQIKIAAPAPVRAGRSLWEALDNIG